MRTGKGGGGGGMDRRKAGSVQKINMGSRRGAEGPKESRFHTVDNLLFLFASVLINLHLGFSLRSPLFFSFLFSLYKESYILYSGWMVERSPLPPYI